jgi:uncharacterized protein (DUF1778 family)
MLPPEPKRTTVMYTRVDPAELALIQAAAKKRGLRVSTYVRDTMIRAAKRETSK